MLNAEQITTRIKAYEYDNYDLEILNDRIKSEIELFADKCFPEVKDYHEYQVIRAILFSMIISNCTFEL